VERRKALLRITISVLALGSLSSVLTAMAQRPPVLVRSAIAGEVVGEGLARVNQDVKQGDPLVYVRSTTESRPVLAAVAPVDGRVLRVTVRPGSHVNIGDIVAAIQPP
jgi:multidrug efflux pump subunit AcrA (membrane-fusion protein)